MDMTRLLEDIDETIVAVDCDGSDEQIVTVHVVDREKCAALIRKWADVDLLKLLDKTLVERNDLQAEVERLREYLETIAKCSSMLSVKAWTQRALEQAEKPQDTPWTYAEDGFQKGEGTVTKHIGSVFEDESELLKTVLHLHNDGNRVHLDPMFSKGNIYRGLAEPMLKYDIRLERPDVTYGDARHLPIESGVINSMLLDPPFCFGVHGKTKSNISAKRFTMFKDIHELTALYYDILSEATRVLRVGGLLLFKCQDYTDSKTTMTHCYVYQLATSMGFYAKDLAILVNRNRIFNPSLTQRHLRKTHSYYWVFINAQKPQEEV